MTSAVVLLTIVIINHYFPNVPFLKDFIKTKGSAWVKIYMDLMINTFKRFYLIRGEVVAVLVVAPVIIITYLLNNLFHLLLKEWGDAIFKAFIRRQI